MNMFAAMPSGPPPVNGNANGSRAVFASGGRPVWLNPSMSRRIKTLAALFLLCLAPAALAGGKKEPAPVISFHMETDATDNPKMTFQVVILGKVRYFRRMSEISTRDIAEFSPFPDDLGGNTYGMAVRLKPHAVNRLGAITAVNLDRWMAASINGQIRDAVKIDKQINDGTLVIWKAVQLAEINALDKTIPRIGQKEAKGKKKKD
jgi:hypothetical protein